MAQNRYECSQCDKLSCNKAAADQHNRDMHGSCADVFPLRSRRDLLTEIARHKRDKEALHSTIENCVSAGASLQAEIARLTAALEFWMGDHDKRWAAQMARADKAEAERDAIAAAAFEAAAQDCEDWADLECAPSLELIRNSIRALSPADAKAALDRMLREARAEGMRESAAVCMMEDVGETYEDCRDAILARAKDMEAGNVD